MQRQGGGRAWGVGAATRHAHALEPLLLHCLLSLQAIATGITGAALSEPVEALINHFEKPYRRLWEGDKDAFIRRSEGGYVELRCKRCAYGLEAAWVGSAA